MAVNQLKNDLYDRLNVRYIDTDYETTLKFASCDDHVVAINHKGLIKSVMKMSFKLLVILNAPPEMVHRSIKVYSIIDNVSPREQFELANDLNTIFGRRKK